MESPTQSARGASTHYKKTEINLSDPETEDLP